MQKWKARIREARVDKKTNGSKREREFSAKIDIELGLYNPRDHRPRKFRPLDVIVLGFEPGASLLIRRLGEAATKDSQVDLPVEQSPCLPDQSEKEGAEGQGEHGSGSWHRDAALAATAAELLAIETASKKPMLSNFGTDVDLIAASYLLRSISRPSGIPMYPHFLYNNDSHLSPPSQLRRRNHHHPIESTLVSTSEGISADLQYSLHNLSTDHCPETKSVAPFFCTMKHSIITIDLACIADLDPFTQLPKMDTIIDLFKSLMRVCGRYSPYNFDVFLAFTNLSHLERQLEASISNPGVQFSPISYSADDKYVTVVLPNEYTEAAVHSYLSSLLPDFYPLEPYFVIHDDPESEQPEFTAYSTHTEPSQTPSPASRAVLQYILHRFLRIPDPMHVNVNIYPSLVDASDHNSLQKLWSLINDVVVSQALLRNTCFCFGSTPTDIDYGPPAGRWSWEGLRI